MGTVSQALIRPAATADRDAIRDLCLRAFDPAENELVARLAVDLLLMNEDPGSGTHCLVAEVGDRVAGYIAFSPVTVDTSADWLGSILAPLAVSPGLQRAGIGSRLVGHGLERVAGTAAVVVFVYGDPTYYGRFGFSAEAAARFPPPCAPRYPFGWQAKVLRGDGTGGRLSCVPPLREPALW